jgi:hypothetical protein
MTGPSLDGGTTDLINSASLDFGGGFSALSSQLRIGGQGAADASTVRFEPTLSSAIDVPDGLNILVSGGAMLSFAADADADGSYGYLRDQGGSPGVIDNFGTVFRSGLGAEKSDLPIVNESGGEVRIDTGFRAEFPDSALQVLTTGAAASNNASLWQKAGGILTIGRFNSVFTSPKLILAGNAQIDGGVLRSAGEFATLQALRVNMNGGDLFVQAGNPVLLGEFEVIATNGFYLSNTTVHVDVEPSSSSSDALVVTGHLYLQVNNTLNVTAANVPANPQTWSVISANDPAAPPGGSSIDGSFAAFNPAPNVPGWAMFTGRVFDGATYVDINFTPQ